MPKGKVMEEPEVLEYVNQRLVRVTCANCGVVMKVWRYDRILLLGKSLKEVQEQVVRGVMQEILEREEQMVQEVVQNQTMLVMAEILEHDGVLDGLSDEEREIQRQMLPIFEWKGEFDEKEREKLSQALGNKIRKLLENKLLIMGDFKRMEHDGVLGDLTFEEREIQRLILGIKLRISKLLKEGDFTWMRCTNCSALGSVPKEKFGEDTSILIPDLTVTQLLRSTPQEVEKFLKLVTKGKSKLVDEIIPCATNRVPRIRYNVALALYTLAHPKALSTLNRLAEDSNPRVRDAATIAINRIAAVKALGGNKELNGS